MLDVVDDDFENATGGDFTTLDVIKHHVVDLLSIQATLNLMKTGFDSFQGQL